MKLSVIIIAAALAASAIAAPINRFQPYRHYNQAAFPQPSLHLQEHHGPALEPTQWYSLVQYEGYPPGPHHLLVQDHQLSGHAPHSHPQSGSHAPVQPPNAQHRQQTNAPQSPQLEAHRPVKDQPETSKQKAGKEPRPKTEVQERYEQQRKEMTEIREEEGHANAAREWGLAVKGHKSAVTHTEAAFAVSPSKGGVRSSWNRKLNEWKKTLNAAEDRLAEHEAKTYGWRSSEFNRSVKAAKKSQKLAEERVKIAKAVTAA